MERKGPQGPVTGCSRETEREVKGEPGVEREYFKEKSSERKRSTGDW